jgi:hypothetical protein
MLSVFTELKKMAVVPLGDGLSNVVEGPPIASSGRQVRDVFALSQLRPLKNSGRVFRQSGLRPFLLLQYANPDGAGKTDCVFATKWVYIAPLSSALVTGPILSFDSVLSEFSSYDTVLTVS